MGSFWWYSGLLAVGAGLSVRWNWWRWKRSGIPILMYHKVGAHPPGSKLAKLWVATPKFRRQMSFLSREGYTPITFKEIYAHWDSGQALPAKPVVITFDDGYANNYHEAFPVLRDFGFRAVLFVVTETVGRDNVWHNPESETRIDMVSWDQLRELQRAGWEIGSHTLNHPRLPQQPLERVAQEVAESRQRLATQLGEAPLTFAYPYGAGADDPQIQERVRDAGYRLAVSVHPGKWSMDRFKADPLCLPRVFVRGEENLYDFHLQLTRGQSRL